MGGTGSPICIPACCGSVVSVLVGVSGAGVVVVGGGGAPTCAAEVGDPISVSSSSLSSVAVSESVDGGIAASAHWYPSLWNSTIRGRWPLRLTIPPCLFIISRITLAGTLTYSVTTYHRGVVVCEGEE